MENFYKWCDQQGLNSKIYKQLKQFDNKKQNKKKMTQSKNGQKT